MDHYWDIATGETIKGDIGPVATATKCGYIVSGVHHDDSINGAQQSLSTMVLRTDGKSRDDEVELKNFWDLETIGIKEQNVEDEFDVKIQKENGKYLVNLPWKNEHELLCDNYNLAERRLMSTLKRFRRDPELAREYIQIIKYQAEKGIIEEVNEKEECLVGKTYYNYATSSRNSRR